MGQRIARRSAIGAGLVGALVFVEFVSGVLQGYYTPLQTDIARHLGVGDADLNWLEATQLLVSALVVPALSKLGDLWGHQRLLLWSSVIVAAANWGIAFAPDFTSYLVFWAVQGVFTVWLPLEVALIFLRSRGLPDRPSATRRATGVIVAALQAGAIAGALGAGAASALLGPLWAHLAVPAVLSTAVIGAVHWGVEREHARRPGVLDGPGLALVSVSLVCVVGGLSLVRLVGVSSPWPWVAIVAGIVLLVPFVRYELRVPDPLIDVRVMLRPAMWPIQATAMLFGVSILGAQVPLTTFARTDPVEHGFGLGLTAPQFAPIVGGYVFSMLIGALVFARLAMRFTPRVCLIVAATAVAVGYGSLVPFHHSSAQLVACMVIAGLGAGALVAALPAAAAASAPEDRTGVATGLTNSAKTIGGSFASCVFGVALAAGATGTAASLRGYYIVWCVCAGTAVVAAVLLWFVPRLAFADPERFEEVAP